jgi:hypothetical protein
VPLYFIAVCVYNWAPDKKNRNKRLAQNSMMKHTSTGRITEEHP